ncbi:MAG: hypothetical protein ACRD2I_11140 [Vicinamibacterales bacterium]
MTLGRLGEPKRLLCDHIASAMTDRGVPARLASRIAFQLVLKCEPSHLGSLTTWQAMGNQVRAEVEHLREGGLVDRQIIVALPKLSAVQVDALQEALRDQDPTIARTILNVALDAAEPVRAAQRYLREFHRVVTQLKTVDPRIARTIANATFMARIPTRTATAHYRRFARLFSTFHDNVAFARTVARTACRSSDPLGAAERVIAAYHETRRALTAKGAAPEIARSLAGIASVATEPMPTASKLLENFRAVLSLANETHPSIGRSIALAACRAADPDGTVRQYLKNYDRVFQFVRRTDPDLAQVVALQTCRSHDPMRWAQRFLNEQRQRRPR